MGSMTGGEIVTSATEVKQQNSLLSTYEHHSL
jgi:hypothetical protein